MIVFLAKSPIVRFLRSRVIEIVSGRRSTLWRRPAPVITHQVHRPRRNRRGANVRRGGRVRRGNRVHQGCVANQQLEYLRQATAMQPVRFVLHSLTPNNILVINNRLQRRRIERTHIDARDISDEMRALFYQIGWTHDDAIDLSVELQQLFNEIGHTHTDARDISDGLHALFHRFGSTHDDVIDMSKELQWLFTLADEWTIDALLDELLSIVDLSDSFLDEIFAPNSPNDDSNTARYCFSCFVWWCCYTNSRI